MAGVGRTATMAAAYWIRRGFTAGEAIARLRQDHPPAVQTREQQDTLYVFERYIKDPQNRSILKAMRRK